MKRATIALGVTAALAACAPPAEEKNAAAAPATPAAEAPATPAAASQPAKMVDLPDDPVQIARLEKMGYTVHDDHLHAPGVSTCPKMGDDPVM